MVLLKKCYFKVEVIVVDFVLLMLQMVKKYSVWLKLFQCVCVEVIYLFFFDYSVDVLYFSLCFQWIDDFIVLFNECVCVFKLGGLLVFFIFGLDMLKELCVVWVSVDE